MKCYCKVTDGLTGTFNSGLISDNASCLFDSDCEGKCDNWALCYTNCGGSEIGGRNPSYLKYSAAHSTIIINNTNISEVKEDDIKTKFPKQVMFESKEDKNQIIFKGSHNGYLKNFKKICKRELVVYKKKNLFIGKDTLISSKSTNNKSVFHIRFHIMPEISTNITSNKKKYNIKNKTK